MIRFPCQRAGSWTGPTGTILAGLAAGVILLAGASAAQAWDWYDPDNVIRVEEDWELVLNAPDNLIEAPQFHTVMSPYSHLDSHYALVLWNYRESDGDFVPGGLQLQSWGGDYQRSKRDIYGDPLSRVAETITWTQILETNGIELAFAIDNGNSETWGAFGRGIRITYYTLLPHLGAYNTDTTVENSYITFGANRVDSLVIKEVRRYGHEGLLSVDSTRRVVYEFQDQQGEDGSEGPMEDWISE